MGISTKTLTPEEMKKAIDLMDDENRLANAKDPRESGERGDGADDYDSESLPAHAERTAEIRVKHIMSAARGILK